MHLSSKLRSSSWVVAIASILVPGLLLVYQLTQFERWAETQGGHLCGMPVLAAWILAITLSAILSSVASGLNGVHLWRSRPVAPKRYAELAVVALPAVAGATLVLIVVVGH